MNDQEKLKVCSIVIAVLGLILGIYQWVAGYQYYKNYCEWGTVVSVLVSGGGSTIPFFGALIGWIGAVKVWGMHEFLATFFVLISWTLSGLNIYCKKTGKNVLDLMKAFNSMLETKPSDGKDTPENKKEE